MRTRISLKEVVMAVALGATVGAIPAGLEGRGLNSEALSKRDDNESDSDDSEDEDDDKDKKYKYKGKEEDERQEQRATNSKGSTNSIYSSHGHDELETGKPNPVSSSSLLPAQTGKGENYNAAASPVASPTAGPSASSSPVRDTAGAQNASPTVVSSQHAAAHHLALGLGIAGGLVLGIILCVTLFMMYLKYKNRLPTKYDPFKLFGRRSSDDGIPPPNGFFTQSEKSGNNSPSKYNNNNGTRNLDLDEARTEMMESEVTTLFMAKYSERNDRVVAKPARAAVERSSQVSDRSMRFPVSGGSLPRNPSAYKKRQDSSDPFSDENATKNPFEDPKDDGSSSAEAVTIKRGQGSVRSVRTMRRQSIRVESMKSPSPLTLTDPRVRTDGRKLVVANQRDSMPPEMSPMPTPVAPLKFPKRAVQQQPQQTPGSQRSSSLSNSGAPQISRFSWTTKADTPLMETTPKIGRMSGVSNASDESQPQFRSINSWVAHQNKHAKKRMEKDIDEESEHWAKSIADYDRKSETSGWDTRRTMTEY